MILIHYQTTNFRLFQTERVCRRQFQIWWKWQEVIRTGRKLCGKRRNCLLQAISPFPTVFSKGLFPRGVKRCHCVGMGYVKMVISRRIFGFFHTFMKTKPSEEGSYYNKPFNAQQNKNTPCENIYIIVHNFFPIGIYINYLLLKFHSLILYSKRDICFFNSSLRWWK